MERVSVINGIASMLQALGIVASSNAEFLYLAANLNLREL